jgi:hypothetical protein
LALVAGALTMWLDLHSPLASRSEMKDHQSQRGVLPVMGGSRGVKIPTANGARVGESAKSIIEFVPLP